MSVVLILRFELLVSSWKCFFLLLCSPVTNFCSFDTLVDAGYYVYLNFYVLLIEYGSINAVNNSQVACEAAV